MRPVQFAEQYNAAVLDTSEDFSDLDMMGFLITGCKDKQGRPAVLVVAKRYQAAVLQPERVLRYGCDTSLSVAIGSAPVLIWANPRIACWATLVHPATLGPSVTTSGPASILFSEHQ
jgi:hypothetical protein